MQPLWDQLHDLFEKDDGSLPEVRVDYRDRNAVMRGYELLRSRVHAISDQATFWSIAESQSKHIDSVPNPAALVVYGKAESFHVVFGGISFGRVVLPELGVFVFPDRLALDYRMGPKWGPAELEAFFKLLAELSVLDPKSTLSLDESILPEIAARFQDSWIRFREQYDA